MSNRLETWSKCWVIFLVQEIHGIVFYIDRYLWVSKTNRRIDSDGIMVSYFSFRFHMCYFLYSLVFLFSISSSFSFSCFVVGRCACVFRCERFNILFSWWYWITWFPRKFLISFSATFNRRSVTLHYVRKIQ